MTQADTENVFTVLQSDHRALVGELRAATTAADADLLPARCEQLVMNLVRHFVAEEQYLLPLVREVLPDGAALSREAFAEHRAVEDQLRRLEDVEHAPAGARLILTDVAAAIDTHVAAQEGAVFPALQERCDEARLRELRDKVLGSEQLAPTRPRAVLVESPTANKFVSLVEGYVDHARDHYARRGVEHEGAPDSAD